jgi:PIN domain nuclease of toxin-antitoxin system
LWWRLDAPQLPLAARRAIARADQVFVSATSAWEVAIKVALGKLRLEEPFAAMTEDSGFQQLPVSFAHAERLMSLPPLHTDPFDRMLVAQAAAEDLVLVTHDQRLADYGVAILWS